MSEYGPLTEKVIRYQDTVRNLVPGVETAQDWAPLGELIDTSRFERIGTFLEKQDWHQYTEMLTGWAQSVDSFDTSVRRISEIGALVYFEIEERHFFGGNANPHVVNSLTVFEFDEEGDKIVHVDVFLQQPAS